MNIIFEMFFYKFLYYFCVVLVLLFVFFVGVLGFVWF